MSEQGINKSTYYICWGCAGLYGAEWPIGHVATCHEGKCDNCGETASLAHKDDWNWPGKKPAKWDMSGRD
jgi:hypothetical protein